MLRKFDKDFSVLAPALLNGGSDVEDALERTEAIASDISAGQMTEAVVGRHLQPLMKERTAKRRGVGFFKATLKILRTLFFCAALGVFGIISVGIIAYGLTVEFFLFTAVGGGLAIACLVGMINYVVRCIKDLKAEPVPASPLPAMDMEVAQ